MPDIIVHTLAEARAALTAAAEAGRPIVLWSPADAVRSMGAAYFLTVIRLAREEVPAASSRAVLDCGDAPGLALAALQAGAEAVRLTSSADVRAKVADIAAKLGSTVETGTSSAALDLSRTADPLAAARTYLQALPPERR